MFLVYRKNMISWVGLVMSESKIIFDWHVQCCIVIRSLLTLDTDWSMWSTTENGDLSSANKKVLMYKPRGKDLIQIKKNIGPKIDRCGTPTLKFF